MPTFLMQLCVTDLAGVPVPEVKISRPVVAPSTTQWSIEKPAFDPTRMAVPVF